MLTKKQKQVLDFISSYHKKKGYSPSLEEIRKNFKLASVSTAYFHVKKLEKLGLLRKGEHQPRSLSTIKKQEMIEVPIVGTIAAGQPIEAIETYDDTILVETSIAME